MKKIVIAFLAFCQVTVACALEYTAIPLGQLPDGKNSVGFGINASNTVVGHASDSVGTYAFSWTEGSGMTTLPSLNNLYTDTRARAINDQGMIVGYFTNDYGNEEAFAYLPKTRRSISLGFLAGGDRSVALSVNNRGQVVGWSKTTAGTEAFTWKSERGMRGLGDLPGGNYESRARDINDLGHITGFGSVDGGSEMFIHYPDGRGMVSLGSPGVARKSAIGMSISDAGMIAGGGNTYSCHEACYWNGTSGFVSMGDLEGGRCYSVFYGSNNANEMVGIGETDNGTEAIFWSEATGLVRLADLIIDGSLGNYTLYEARAINDSGYVVANAFDLYGKSEVILLAPSGQ